MWHDSIFYQGSHTLYNFLDWDYLSSVCRLHVLLPDAKSLQVKNSIKRGCVKAYRKQWIWDANLLLPHQCLLVDHETQSGRWWSACQCQRTDKDISLPLYKSPPLAAVEWTWGFYLWVNLPGKKQFVNGSSAFKPYQVWCGGDWQVPRRTLLDSAGSAVDIWGQ